MKGFAFVLGATVVLAVLLTQAVLGLMSRSPSSGTRPRWAAGKRSHHWWESFDFMGASKWFFSASGVIHDRRARHRRRGPELGIDFESRA